MRTRLSSTGRVALLSSLLFGCHPDAGAGRASSTGATSPGPTAAATTTETPPGDLSATSSAAAPTASEKAIPPLERDKNGLLGRTIDYPYDGKDVKDPTRAYEGRIFVHEKALRSLKPVPLVIFLHGLNRDLIPHRWIGGGNEGDVRKIVSELMESNAIPPVVLAGPGSVEKAAVSGGASFPVFDHDKLVAQVKQHLGDAATIDEERVIVTGHSGAGCSDKGGVIAAATAKRPPLAIVSIDTCMAGPLAEALGGAPPKTHVIVTWQIATWERNFKHFRSVFDKARDSKPPETGVLRELDQLPTLPKSHDATVKQTFDKWLPRLLGPG